MIDQLDQIKKLSVLGNDSKILGRVGTFFFNYFFSWKKNNFMHFESRNAFQKAWNYIFFSENPMFLGFTSKIKI